MSDLQEIAAVVSRSTIKHLACMSGQFAQGVCTYSARHAN